MTAIETLRSVADGLDAERLVGSATDIREAAAKLETLLQTAEEHIAKDSARTALALAAAVRDAKGDTQSSGIYEPRPGWPS